MYVVSYLADHIVGFLEGLWVVLVGLGVGYRLGLWLFDVVFGFLTLLVVGLIVGLGLDLVVVGLIVGLGLGLVVVGFDDNDGDDVGDKVGDKVHCVLTGNASSPIWRGIDES